MYRIHPADLQRMHDELQAAIRNHAEWHRHLVRTLVCRLRPDPDDLGPDAHRICAFGQWFYDQAQRDLAGRPEYGAIDAEHRHLHEVAAQLLREAAGQGPATLETFDRFIDASGRLRHDLDALRHEMAVALRSRDTLTGALRRVELLPTLNEAHELVVRGVQASCIAFMDLDHFKAVNDAHGHGVGDEVLAQAARCVIGHLRQYDKVFRYGGDEFLLLLPGTGPEEAWHLADRIRAGLAQATLGTTPAGTALALSASFGVTSLEPGVPVEESVARADKALLLAKASGRNRVVCWDPSCASGTAAGRDFSARPASPDSAVR
jgi:diguanylate cyclase (GGDEF)-like protein